MKDTFFGRLKFVLFGEEKKVEDPKTKPSVINSPVDERPIPERKMKYVNRDPEPKKAYVLGIIDNSKTPLNMAKIILKGSEKYSHVTIRRYVKILEEEGKIARDPDTGKYSRIIR
jgi:hypothetical protein